MKLRSLRWFLLLVFPGALLFSPLTYNNGINGVGFVFLNLASFLALALLLTRLGRPWRHTLWVWIILGVLLVGYVGKTLLIGSNLHYWKYETSWFYELQDILTLDMVAGGYCWVTFAFFVFCVVSWWLLGPPRARRRFSLQPVSPAELSHANLRFVFWITCILLVTAVILREHFAIGIHGIPSTSASTALPLRLGTVIVRAPAVLSGVLLLCIWVAGNTGQGKLARAGVGMAVLLGLSVSLITTSRGALLAACLPILFLWLLTERTPRHVLAIFGLATGATLLLFPLVNFTRFLAMTTGQKDMISRITDAVSLVGTATRHQGIVVWTGGLRRLILRVIGADGIWFVLNHLPPGFSYEQIRRVLVDNSMTLYYTRTVVGTTHEATHRAPGLIAAYMLLGGAMGVALLWPLTLWSVRMLWRWLMRFRTAPVALSLFTMAVYSFAQEGTLDFKSPVVAFFTILLCEWLYRYVLVRRFRRRREKHELVRQNLNLGS